MNRNLYSFFLLGLSVLYISCQPKRNTETAQTDEAKPAVATLSKSTYTLGDTIVIQLSKPLAEASVTLRATSTPIIQRSDSSLTIRAKSIKTGLHSLIISGKLADQSVISDTLNIELWSDFRPVALRYSVLKQYPHQSESFTQGLEFYRGNLYESTGLNGQSKLMLVDLATGAIKKSVSLDSQYFGEGITIFRDKIYQLTWTSGVCFRYNLDFTLDKTFTYHTQGWGLTHTDSTLILSDGTNRLFFLTPDFQRKGELAVYDNLGPVMNLNELEYVNGYVFANVWQTNRIVQIDVSTGKVVGELSMDAILPKNVDTKANVLNGIAYQADENALYVTGKNWPTLFKIQLKNLPNRIVALR
ncbi:glutaminyl-peptide cyclotransferase [Spirosoma gilvum]